MGDPERSDVRRSAARPRCARPGRPERIVEVRGRCRRADQGQHALERGRRGARGKQSDGLRGAGTAATPTGQRRMTTERGRRLAPGEYCHARVRNDGDPAPGHTKEDCSERSPGFSPRRAPGAAPSGLAPPPAPRRSSARRTRSEAGRRRPTPHASAR